MSGTGGEPLLVTGMPRTATSWVGKVLEASGALVYVNEPLNPQHPPGRSPGVLRGRRWPRLPVHQRGRLGAGVPGHGPAARPPPGRAAPQPPPLEPGLHPQVHGWVRRGAPAGRRALLHDPYAVFAAPWLARRVGCPGGGDGPGPGGHGVELAAARLDPQLAELLAQPALVTDRLARFTPDLEAAVAGDGDRADGVGPASLLWRVIYGTVAAYREEVPGLEVVRHEDLSADPVPGLPGPLRAAM